MLNEILKEALELLSLAIMVELSGGLYVYIYMYIYIYVHIYTKPKINQQ